MDDRHFVFDPQIDTPFFSSLLENPYMISELPLSTKRFELSSNYLSSLDSGIEI
jgi:hypothetical protein